MRPEKPIHCIVWAKMLFETFFGASTEENDLKDLAEISKGDCSTVMIKLFQEEIENIKNAKSDTDSKLSQSFAKSIKSIPAQTII